MGLIVFVVAIVLCGQAVGRLSGLERFEDEREALNLEPGAVTTIAVLELLASVALIAGIVGYAFSPFAGLGVLLGCLVAVGVALTLLVLHLVRSAPGIGRPAFLLVAIVGGILLPPWGAALFDLS